MKKKRRVKRSSRLSVSSGRSGRKITMLSVALVLFLAIEVVSIFSSIGGGVTGYQTSPITGTPFNSIQDFVISFVSPVGFENQWTGIVIGILATIMIFVIILDVMNLALPFSRWVNYVLAIGFVIAGGLLGMVRTVAGYGLVIGSYITGGAGAIALIVSAVLILVVIIVLFFGSQKMAKWVARARGNREIIDAEKAAYKKGANIKGLETEAAAVAGK